MPSKQRRQKAAARSIDLASRNTWECPFCHRLFASYKNGPKKHLRSCPRKPQAPTTNQVQIDPIDDDDDSSVFSDTAGPSIPSSGQNQHTSYSRHTLSSRLPASAPFLTPGPGTESEPETTSVEVPDLGETEVWIRRHPASGQASGYDTRQSPRVTITTAIQPARSRRFFPLSTEADFLQAEVFSKNNCSDGHINDQLAVLHKTGAYSNLPISERLTLKDANDYHSALARSPGVSENFSPRSFTTSFKGYDFVHEVRSRPVLPALQELVSDPDFASIFVLHPEQRFIRRSESDPRPMRVWEELEHGDDWWKMQDSIPHNHFILYLVVYIDETNVSTIGGVSVWPVFVWVGNLPAATRKQRVKKGGAILVGYLPEARNGEIAMSDSELAEFRARVYHDALAIVFETLNIPARHGTPMKCGDGQIRISHPTIGVIAADYKEFKSKFPCPICLVPNAEQGNLLGTWSLRTVEGSQDLVANAIDASTNRERHEILHEQSIRGMMNVFHDIIPSFFSVYLAVAADPLHQIEQGIFGKHIWPWLRDSLSNSQATILDARCIPRYPDFKHFPNGITKLKNITGTEFGVILRVISPLVEDLLMLADRKAVLSTLRSLATIHLLSKFTTHTEATLEQLEEQIGLFNSAYSDLAALHPSIGLGYPKLHSLSHLVDIIRRKSTTDNYHTGLGEALHPQSKIDYRHTNHQDGFQDQMLRTYQERELLIRIRARIDQQNAIDDGEFEHIGDENSRLDRVELGGLCTKMLTSTYAQERIACDSGAQHFVRELRTFLYQEARGFANTVHFRERSLPSLEGTTVSLHRVLRIEYVSLLDSRSGLDVARVTDSWRRKGPRHDYVLYDDRLGLAVAQLLGVFTLKIAGENYPIAYIRPLRVLRRNVRTHYIELKDEHVRNFIFVGSIIRSCIVLSPGIRPDIHVLHDVEGPDMYLRLMSLY
ncbi:hypothetical protein RhiJN_18408 [Ceratobasidium sp. AG-Ba]|nr:hypothetical protein RhiJN_18408 [Ceratobasidium sp. AG-Ba]